MWKSKVRLQRGEHLLEAGVIRDECESGQGRTKAMQRKPGLRKRHQCEPNGLQVESVWKDRNQADSPLKLGASLEIRG